MNIEQWKAEKIALLERACNEGFNGGVMPILDIDQSGDYEERLLALADDAQEFLNKM